jgi:hypothetical protein
MRMTDRLKHGWNAFMNNDRLLTFDRGPSSSRPSHKTGTFFNTSSYVSSIYNRIAMDVSMTGFKHVKIDRDNEDVTHMDTALNGCLNVEANIDQTHMQFIQDVVYSMFDEGVVAVVPVETTLNPLQTGSYDINSLRVGRIVSWFPKHVEVNLYNDTTGQNERVTLEKKNVAIVENPLYAVVNDDNSTLKRMIRKLNQLDTESDAGRLDLLISVPYTVKTESQRKMAEKRIADIEAQLVTGRHGIAYIDGTEKAMQMNRPVNSQLPEEVNSLKKEFYNQLGLTENVFNGTASESELRTYYSRTIDPIVDNIIAEFNRKFLTKTARTQGQAIVTYRDMFKTATVESVAQLGDTFRRNSIASANEIRKIVGLKPSNDPRADELFNPNIADNNQNGVSGSGPSDTGETDISGKVDDSMEKIIEAMTDEQKELVYSILEMVPDTEDEE